MPKKGNFYPFQQWFWTHLDLGSEVFQTRVWVPTLDSGTRVLDSSLDALQCEWVSYFALFDKKDWTTKNTAIIRVSLGGFLLQVS